MTDFGQAQGQYGLYRFFLRHTVPQRELYPAIPQDVLEDFFYKASGQRLLTDKQDKVFGYDSESEVIVQWLPEQL